MHTEKMTGLLLAALTAIACGRDAVDELAAGFRNPPQDARPQVWWHWMDGNITKDGLRKDIEWMDRAGIGGFHAFDAGLRTPPVVEHRLIYMDEGWQEAFRYAIAEGSSHGMEMSIATAPGWSATGGPWVPAEDAMKRLTWREWRISGGQRYKGALPEPYATAGRFQNVPLGGSMTDALSAGHEMEPYYEDIAVLAFRLNEDDRTMQELGAVLTSSGGEFSIDKMTDGDLAEACFLPVHPSGHAWLQYAFPAPQEVSALTLADGRVRDYWDDIDPDCSAALECSDDGLHFKEVTKIPAGGAARQTISFPPVKARYYRLKVANPAPDYSLVIYGGPVIIPEYTRIAEFVLHPLPRVNHAEEKAGFASPFDLHRYPTVSDRQFGHEAIDLTAHVHDGALEWEAPEGEWKLFRFGYALTGKMNHPAPMEATGYEVDKLDPEAFSRYLRHYLDMYKETLGGSVEALSYLMMDSYEAEQQTWTPRMREEFSRRRGYDLLPWLPALTGEIIGSAAQTEQFLKDWRKTIGELYVENYEQASAIAREYGMKGRYTESHENGRVYVADGMDVKRKAEIPMAACWVPTPGAGSTLVMSQADIRESASVAHFWGQNLVAGESLTASGMGGKAWSYDPRSLKWVADTEMACGLNRFVIHESAHQPLDSLVPGLSLMIFGQWFNRHETWAEEAQAWTDYLARSSYLLQQGRNVADVLIYYGEDTNVTAEYGASLPDYVPAGYSYDFINPTGLLQDIKVKKNRLTAPSGASYQVLCVDADPAWMSSEVSARIEALKKQGAAVCSPEELADVLARTSAPDAVLPEGLRFVHRHTDNAEIYWVNKPSDDFCTIEASFRVTGRKPQVWHPEDGRMEEVSYRTENGRTAVSLDMVPDDALFVVFSGKGADARTCNPVRTASSQPVSGPWTVTFQAGRGSPASAVLEELVSLSDSETPGIRYFSGTAAYSCSFVLNETMGRRICLDLGRVENIARVRVNGADCGTVWKEPYMLDVTKAVREGENELCVEVTNLWPNRIIGDLRGDGGGPYTFTAMPFFRAEMPLLPSGLIGPVTLSVLQ